MIHPDYARLIVLPESGGWIARWLGAEASGSSPLEALKGVLLALRNARYGTAYAPPDVVEVTREAWPEISELAHELGIVSEKRVEPRANRGGIDKARNTAEISVIRAALAQFDGNRTATARALGISRFGLQKKIQRLGIE